MYLRRIPLLPTTIWYDVTRNMNLVHLSLPNSLGTHGCDATIRRHWTRPRGSKARILRTERMVPEINLAKWNNISPTDRFPWNSRGPISLTKPPPFGVEKNRSCFRSLQTTHSNYLTQLVNPGISVPPTVLTIDTRHFWLEEERNLQNHSWNKQENHGKSSLRLGDVLKVERPENWKGIYQYSLHVVHWSEFSWFLSFCMIIATLVTVSSYRILNKTLNHNISLRFRTVVSGDFSNMDFPWHNTNTSCITKGGDVTWCHYNSPQTLCRVQLHR